LILEFFIETETNGFLGFGRRKEKHLWEQWNMPVRVRVENAPNSSREAVMAVIAQALFNASEDVAHFPLKDLNKATSASIYPFTISVPKSFASPTAAKSPFMQMIKSAKPVK